MSGIIDDECIIIKNEASELKLYWSYFNKYEFKNGLAYLIKDKSDRVVLSEDLFSSKNEFEEALKLFNSKIKS